MRNHLSQTVIVTDYSELLEYLEQDGKTIEISTVDQLSEEAMMVTYKMLEEYIVENSASNIVISMFVTSYAR